jgi:phytoene dehydrogenase-like protein
MLALERNDSTGGGIRTDGLIIPGFFHDVYAGYLILFAISQAYADLGPKPENRGLILLNCGTPAGVSFPDGKASLVITDMEANIAEAERLVPGDV